MDAITLIPLDETIELFNNSTSILLNLPDTLTPLAFSEGEIL